MIEPVTAFYETQCAFKALPCVLTWLNAIALYCFYAIYHAFLASICPQYEFLFLFYHFGLTPMCQKVFQHNTIQYFQDCSINPQVLIIVRGYNSWYTVQKWINRFCKKNNKVQSLSHSHLAISYFLLRNRILYICNYIYHHHPASSRRLGQYQILD